MGRTTSAILVLCFVLGLAFFGGLHGGRSSAATSAWPACPAPPVWLGDPSEIRVKLIVKACGPTRVIRGVPYSYTAQVTNIGRTTYRTVDLTVLHYDPIVRSSAPYRRQKPVEPYYMPGAVWTRKNFKPGQTLRVGIRLPFLQHKDPKGSNLVLVARARGPKHSGQSTKDVHFVRGSS